MHLNQCITPANRLLDGLPEIEYKGLMMKFEIVNLVHKEVLCNAGDKINYVYFPIQSIISLMKHIDAEKTLEVGMIGNEGMLGSTLLLGIDEAPFKAIVQKTGATLRMSATAFNQELEQRLLFKQQLKRYLYLSLSQLVQNAACIRFHVVEERLARLLLMIRDREQSQSFHITQESLAQMMGVRRVGVTIAAGSLQNKKLISYKRGNLIINNNAGLEAISCSCYQRDNETYRRIFNA